MPSAPYPVSFRLTTRNRNSVAALLAVLEAELGPEQWRPRLLARADDFDGQGLLVYSFMSCSARTAGRELSALRARFGELDTIAGGPHPSADPDGTLALGFRWAAIGEAGPALAEFIRALARGERPAPGVLGPDAPRPLDAYAPWPRSGELFSHIDITRGCPMGCTFCQTPRLVGREPRHRSIPELERIFRHAVETGHRYTRFVAPNAFAYGARDGRHLEPRAVEALLTAASRAGYREVYFGTFPSEVRPESVTEEMLALVRAHCSNRTIAVGMQSGSERVLRAMKRGHTVAEAVRAVELIARAGFEPKIDFIFGLPGETDADRADTRALIDRLIADCGASVHVHEFTPLPGTPLADTRPEPIDGRTRAWLEELAGRQKATGVGRG